MFGKAHSESFAFERRISGWFKLINRIMPDVREQLTFRLIRWTVVKRAFYNLTQQIPPLGAISWWKFIKNLSSRLRFQSIKFNDWLKYVSPFHAHMPVFYMATFSYCRRVYSNQPRCCLMMSIDYLLFSQVSIPIGVLLLSSSAHNAFRTLWVQCKQWNVCQPFSCAASSKLLDIHNGSLLLCLARGYL